MCGVGWPVLVSVLVCPLTLPRNDAFAYSQIAQTLSDHGTIRLVGYGRMSLIGHILLAQPFFGVINNRELAGNVFGITMMTFATVLGYVLARRFLRPGLATVAVLALLFAPGVANTTPTFMTEPTFLCLTLGSLLAGVLAYQSRRHTMAWLIASVVLGFASFTVREFGVVAPFAVVAALVFGRRLTRAAGAGLAGGVLVACLAFYGWHQHLSGLEGTALQLHVRSILRPVLALFTLGFYVLPASLRPALSLLRSRSRLTMAGAIVTAVLALPALGFSSTGHKLFSDDMLGRFGVSGQAVLSGTRPALFPLPVWVLLNAIALFGGICLVVVVIELMRRRWTSRERDGLLPLEVFAVAYAVLTAVYGTVVNQLDDRYIWPLVLPLAVVIFSRTAAETASAGLSRSARWLMALPLLVLFATSTGLNQDVAAYDAAGWQAAQKLVDAGIPASQIDGGLEWEGAHSSAIADLAAADNRVISASDPYYEGFWPPSRRCFVVSNSPPEAGGRLLATPTYQSQLGLRARPLFVWVRAGQVCAAMAARLGSVG